MPADDPAPPPIEEAEHETTEMAAGTASSSSWVEKTLLEDEELEPKKVGKDKQPLSPEVVLSVGDKIKVFYK